MKLTRQTLLIICILGTFISSNYAQSNLRLRATDKTYTSFQLNNIRKLSFETTDFVSITNMSGNTTKYNLIDYNYLDFNSIATEITTPTAADNSLRLYPNPVISNLNIQLTTSFNEKLIIEIYTLQGNIIHKASQIALNDLCNINLSELQSGIYFCKVIYGENIAISKFIKK